MGKQWKQCQTLFFWAPKSLQMVTAAMKLMRWRRLPAGPALLDAAVAAAGAAEPGGGHHGLDRRLGRQRGQGLLHENPRPEEATWP